jgi:hypothetical protein
MKRGRGDHVFDVNESLLARQILHLKYTAYNPNASVYKPFLNLNLDTTSLQNRIEKGVSVMTGPLIHFTLCLDLASIAISRLLSVASVGRNGPIDGKLRRSEISGVIVGVNGYSVGS